MVLTYQSNDAGSPSKRNTYEMVVLIFLDLFDSPDSVPLTQAYHCNNNKKRRGGSFCSWQPEILSDQPFKVNFEGSRKFRRTRFITKCLVSEN